MCPVYIADRAIVASTVARWNLYCAIVASTMAHWTLYRAIVAFPVALILSQPQKHPDRISIPSGRSYNLFFCAEAGIFKSDIPYRIKTNIAYAAVIHSEQEARVI